MMCRFVSSRCLSLVVALCCILGQVSSFAHLLLVRHTACASHQNLMEEGAHEESDTEESSQDIATEQTNSPEHQHQDCLVCAQQPKLLHEPHATTLTALLVLSCLAPQPPPRSIVHSAQALLSLAPKTSPPLV